MKKVEKLKALGAKLTGGTVTGNTVGDVLTSIISLADSGTLKDLKSVTGYDATKTQTLQNDKGTLKWVDVVTPG